MNPFYVVCNYYLSMYAATRFQTPPNKFALDTGHIRRLYLRWYIRGSSMHSGSIGRKQIDVPVTALVTNDDALNYDARPHRPGKLMENPKVLDA